MRLDSSRLVIICISCYNIKICSFEIYRARDENLRTGLQLWNENRRDEAARFLKQGANISTKMALELIKVNCEYKKSMKISSRAPNRLNYWNIS